MLCLAKTCCSIHSRELYSDPLSAALLLIHPLERKLRAVPRKKVTQALPIGRLSPPHLEHIPSLHLQIASGWRGRLYWSLVSFVEPRLLLHLLHSLLLLRQCSWLQDCHPCPRAYRQADTAHSYKLSVRQYVACAAEARILAWWPTMSIKEHCSGQSRMLFIDAFSNELPNNLYQFEIVWYFHALVNAGTRPPTLCSAGAIATYSNVMMSLRCREKTCRTIWEHTGLLDYFHHETEQYSWPRSGFRGIVCTSPARCKYM